MAIEQQKLDELLGRAITDFGATFHSALVVIGDKLGLYKALAENDGLTSDQLADKTETNRRYIREWLASQAAGGYVTYDPETDSYSLSDEQTFILADESSPAFVPGAFQVAVAAARIEPKLAKAFKTGKGIGWHEHDKGLFQGTERFFRPNYATNLVSSWLPSLEGVVNKLNKGASVADVGCGHGASTILMAKAYPDSRFTGFDYHTPSIREARRKAKREGLSGRVSFEVASAKDFPGDSYDLVTVFDCLHDMGDPSGAATHIYDTLKKNGTWMIVEPYANDKLEENLNPVGRAFYSVSTLVCTPCSMSQEVGSALGAQAGESRIREVVMKGGFSRFRRATQTPFNLVFEARP